MTRERAIQILKMSEQEKWRSGITVEEEKEAVDMAIEALENEQNLKYEIKDLKNKVEYLEIEKRKSRSQNYIVSNDMLNGEANFCPNCGADMRKEGDEK